MKFTIILYTVVLVFVETQSREIGQRAWLTDNLKSSSQGVEQFRSDQIRSNEQNEPKEITIFIAPNYFDNLENEDNVKPTTESEIAEQDNRQKELRENDQLIREQFDNLRGAKIVERNQRPVYTITEESRIPALEAEKLFNENIFRNDNSNSWKPFIPDQPTRQRDRQLSEIILPSRTSSYPILEITQGSPVEERTQQPNVIPEIKSLPNQASRNEQPRLPNQREEQQRQRYVFKDNDNNEIDVEKLLEGYRLEELSKQNKLSEAEAAGIIKPSPVLIHQEVTITKHRHLPVLKRVTIPISSPVLLRNSESFEGNLRNTNPIEDVRAFDNIKSFPEAIRAENNQLKNLAPFNIQKQNRFVQINRDNTNRRYAEQIVQVPNQRTLKIIRL